MTPYMDESNLVEKRALQLSMLGMGIMALSGLAFAMVSHSNAILLDGVFSSIGLMLSVLTYKVAKLVKRPDDERFHFGYAHFTPQLNMIKALLMITLCVFAMGSAVNTFVRGGTEIEIGLALVYAIIATLSCVVVAVILKRVAKRTGSVLVEVDVQSWIVDALISAAVLLSFAAGFVITGTAWEKYLAYLDPLVVTLLVVIAIPVPMQIFIRSMKETFMAAPSEEDQAPILERVAAALARWEIAEHRVRLLKLGNTMNVLVHARPGPAFELGSIERLDEIRADVKASLLPLGYDLVFDVIFVSDMRYAD